MVRNAYNKSDQVYAGKNRLLCVFHAVNSWLIPTHLVEITKSVCVCEAGMGQTVKTVNKTICPNYFSQF